MGSIPQSTESLLKKRARDRRAQQHARDKRLAQVKALGDHIATLETQLGSLHMTCDSLHRENAALRVRQDHIRDMVRSWDLETPSSGPVLTPTPLGCSDYITFGVDSSSTWSRTKVVSCYEAGDESVTDTCVPEQESHILPVKASAVAEYVYQTRDGTLPSWKQTPVHDKCDIIVTDWFSMWVTKADLARASPASPQPIDILYGSKKNFLANVLHQTSRKWPCRDPERLACGWLAYHLIKWMLDPTEASFSRVCEFQRPVAEQRRHAHPYHVDFVLWPGLRANCVEHQFTYPCEQVAGMLTCCLKLRWPWNKPILEQDDDGQLQMCPGFHDTFTKIDGWTITEEFTTRFPKLFEGLDVRSMQCDFF